MKTEIERQIMHFLVGLATIAVLFAFGRPFTAGAIFFVLLAGLLMINMRIQKVRIPFVEWFVERFERKEVLFSGFGSACYAAGALIPIIFLTELDQIAACILILAIGDGVSTLVGKKGRRKLPYNRSKTLEGTLAFFIGSLPSVLFIGITGVPLAAIAAVVESLDFRIDDNLTVPIACTVFFMVIG